MKQKQCFTRAYFKMRTYISLCGAEVTVNKTHILKQNNALPGESETQHKSKYFAVNRQLICTPLLPQSVLSVKGHRIWPRG
jgi:hypothetical protein